MGPHMQPGAFCHLEVLRSAEQAFKVFYYCFLKNIYTVLHCWLEPLDPPDSSFHLCTGVGPCSQFRLFFCSLTVPLTVQLSDWCLTFTFAVVRDLWLWLECPNDEKKTNLMALIRKKITCPFLWLLLLFPQGWRQHGHHRSSCGWTSPWGTPGSSSIQSSGCTPPARTHLK